MELLEQMVKDRLLPVEVLTLPDGYSKGKRTVRCRRCTMSDIANLDGMRGELLFLDNQGMVRRMRKTSSLKRWKRDETRFECSFKYGLYESVRWDTQEMLARLLIPL